MLLNYLKKFYKNETGKWMKIKYSPLSSIFCLTGFLCLSARGMEASYSGESEQRALIPMPTQSLGTYHLFTLEEPDPVRLFPAPSGYLNNVRNTSNNYGNIWERHAFVIPEFLEEVFTRDRPTIFEAGPGDGFTLEKLLRDKRNQNAAFQYHFCEPDVQSRQQIAKKFKRYNQNQGNQVARTPNKYQDDARQFLQGKSESYDIILTANLVHYFDPLDQLEFFKNMFAALKPEGKAFVIVGSVQNFNLWLPIHYPVEKKNRLNQKAIAEFQKKLTEGDLWAGYNVSEDISRRILSHLAFEQLTHQNQGFYGLPNLHSVGSLEKLLEAIGFRVVDLACFTEGECINPQSQSPKYIANSYRIGAIVQKPKNPIQTKEDLLNDYQRQGLQKREDTSFIAKLVYEETKRVWENFSY
jgi:SAM-dependent methyltransferase